MRVERSREAEDDLDRILTYGTRRFGEGIGDEYFFSFDAAFERLEDNPRIGESIEDIDNGVRKLTHRSHRIFYEIDGDPIHVLRILHHAQDVESNLRR